MENIEYFFNLLIFITISTIKGKIHLLLLQPQHFPSFRKSIERKLDLKSNYFIQ